MSSQRRPPDLNEQQVNRLLRSYLREEWHEDANRVASMVLDELDETPQRTSGGMAWRFQFMNNNVVRVGLAAAAVVIIAIIAINLLPGSPAPGGEPSASPSVQPSATSSPTGQAPSQEVVFNDAGGVGNVAFTFPSSGWEVSADSGYATASGYQSGTGFLVFPGDLWIYGDPCAWSTTTPDTPATTVDEIIAALASQATRDASEPSDITVAGYTGRAITLHVPDDLIWVELGPADCDEATFGTLTAGVDGNPNAAPERFHQGAGQIDEFWVVDVDGRPVALDLSYFPDTPQKVIDEMHAIVESVTFGD